MTGTGIDRVLDSLSNDMNTLKRIVGGRVVKYYSAPFPVLKQRLVNSVPCGNSDVESQFANLPIHVDETFIEDYARISTVLLPFTHVGGDFETMIFGNAGYEWSQWRYKTIEEAQTGHDNIVDHLKHNNADLELAIKKLLNE